MKFNKLKFKSFTGGYITFVPVRNKTVSIAAGSMYYCTPREMIDNPYAYDTYEVGITDHKDENKFVSIGYKTPSEVEHIIREVQKDEFGIVFKLYYICTYCRSAMNKLKQIINGSSKTRFVVKQNKIK